MINRHLKPLMLLALTSSLIGCESTTSGGDATSADLLGTFSGHTDYNDFQWAIWTQGQLVMIERDGYWWSAFLQNGQILESFPPKTVVVRHRQKDNLTFPISKLQAPQQLISEGLMVDVYLNENWRSVHAVRLNGQQFEIQTARSGQWIAIEPNNIRFVSR